MFAYCSVETLQDKIHLCQCCTAPAIASSTIFTLGLCFADFKWCFLQNSYDQYWDLLKIFSLLLITWEQLFSKCFDLLRSKRHLLYSDAKTHLRNLSWRNLDSWVSISKGFSHAGFGTEWLAALQEPHCWVNFSTALISMANLDT